MSFVFIAAFLSFAVILYTLFVRAQDLPKPAPVNPVHHLEMRKAAIYENLRDLNFEYRVGKLSDEDYQRTKKELQAELAIVMAEIDRILGRSSTAVPAGAKTQKLENQSGTSRVCPHCGAGFDKPLKFCGECGKAMAVAQV